MTIRSVVVTVLVLMWTPLIWAQKPAAGGSAGGSAFAPAVRVSPADMMQAAAAPDLRFTPPQSHRHGMTREAMIQKERNRLGMGIPTTKVRVQPRGERLLPSSADQPRSRELTDQLGLNANTQTPTAAAPFLGLSVDGGTPIANTFPPDPTMAAGPFQVVVATNSGITVKRKSDGSVISGPPFFPQSLGSFFSSLGTPASDGPFDPHVVFDPYIGRFWVVAASENDGASRSSFLIALSDSEDAAGTWSFFSMDATVEGNTSSGHWCDYPEIGLDAQAVYFTCNMFTFPSTSGSFQDAKVRVMTKDQFVNNTCCSWWDFFQLHELGVFPSFTVQPAVMYGASVGDGEFLVDAAGGGAVGFELVIWQVLNAQRCCGSTQSAPDFNSTTEGVSLYAVPHNARQSGGDPKIDTGDARLLFAFWQGGKLSTGHSIATGLFNGAGAAFEELNVSTFPNNISNINDWVLANNIPDTDYYYPAVAVNNSGDKTMVYSRSNDNQFAGAFYVGIPKSSTCTTCFDGPEVTMHAGQAHYNNQDSSGRNRWGDYLGASPDPDGLGIWVHGEYANATNFWSTQVALTYEAPDTTPPVTTSSIAPPPNGAGWNNSGVLVVLSSSDSGSGVRRLTYSASGPSTISPITINGGFALVGLPVPTWQGISDVAFFAEDNWGNVETTEHQTVKIDAIPPHVVCGTSDGLWHPTDVSIHCVTSPLPLSGLVNPANASFNLTTSVPANTETANASTNSRTVCSFSSLCTTGGPIAGNMVDKKAPVITITAPTATTYSLNQVVAANYGCVDGGSGVANCTGTVPNGNNIDTATVGAKTFTVNSTDNVANASNLSVNYTVSFNVCLLYDPTKPTNGTVPIKFFLCDAGGNNVSSAGIVVQALTITPGFLDAPANPGNFFRFDPTLVAGGGYVFNERTNGFAPGVYVLTFSAAGDPTIHSVSFTLK